MITILFTDTHFGVKQNSITWLNSQINFIDHQLIPYITSEKEPVRLIHLGDVFDSRSTVSTLVATRVVEKFKILADLVDDFIIVGGNHDYYSPTSDSIDTLNLLLGSIDGIKLVTKEIYVDEEDAFVPWYCWLDQQKTRMVVDKYNIKRIFTHADIVTSKFDVNGVDIYSGHIHIPYIKNNIKNLGSCYALNFTDSNTIRGFYVIREDRLQFVENTESIKFYRFYNDEIFNDLSYVKPNDYIEIYISQSNLSKSEFATKIDGITKEYKNIWVIPQATVLESSNMSFDGYDMEAITKGLVPNELKDKFNLILGELNQNI